MINPNATALLGTGFLPAPNSGIANGVGSFVGGANSATNLKEEMVRIDHNFSDKFSVFGHFIAEQISQGYNTAQWSGDAAHGWNTFNNPAYSAVITLPTPTHPSSTKWRLTITATASTSSYAATGLTSLLFPPALLALCRDFTNPACSADRTT
jgi:hypothetical protein